MDTKQDIMGFLLPPWVMIYTLLTNLFEKWLNDFILYLKIGNKSSLKDT